MLEANQRVFTQMHASMETLQIKFRNLIVKYNVPSQVNFQAICGWPVDMDLYFSKGQGMLMLVMVQVLTMLVGKRMRCRIDESGDACSYVLFLVFVLCLYCSSLLWIIIDPSFLG